MRKKNLRNRLVYQSKKIASLVLAASMVFGLGNFSFVGEKTAKAAETVENVAYLSLTSDTATANTQDLQNRPFTWDDATVYFLLTDRFKNGNTSNDDAYGRKTAASKMSDQRATFHGGDFKGITDKIEDGYFDDLGVNAIWLTAPYEQIHGYFVGDKSFYHQSYHGYYVLDYTEPDQAYGTPEEFETLVDTAHSHGIRIVMDVVMNHAGYNDMQSMSEYNFGTLKSGWDSYYKNPPASDTSGYHDNIDYNSSASDWGRWWGNDWIRSGLPGYSEDNSSEITQCLTGLPDFKTESTKQVSVPQFLQTKWQKEGTLSEKLSRYGSSHTVREYICEWLSDWVLKYGVDGFRCDTAKHVEVESWKALKDSCNTALAQWRRNNPTKPGAQWTDKFWMTGEHWNHSIDDGKDKYFTSGAFDSMINFSTSGGGLLSQTNLAGMYSGYASKINSDSSYNQLSYISSHDSTLADRNNLYYLGSALLMLPGGVQIYYGDETARPYVSGVSDGNGGAGHGLRSNMNWNSYSPELLAHWQKVGSFRRNHLSVGAGSNTGLNATSGTAFGRQYSYTYNGESKTDKVAGVVGANNNTSVTVNVASLWSDGTTLNNAYDGSSATVSGGSVTFNSGAHGTILIEEPSVPMGSVTVKYVDKATGNTIKTETLTGEIGESYKVTPATIEGYKYVSVSGSTSGTFSKTPVTVTYTYSFDDVNYAYITVKYVDAADNTEIAESTTETKKVGSTYSVSPKTISKYQVDESLTSNATGTVVKGTTTVVFKYNLLANNTIYLKNDASWSSPCAYMWNNKSGVNNGKWPGVSMTVVNADQKIYEISYSVDDPFDMIIFDNNGGSQTGNITIPTDGTNCYNNSTGKWETYAPDLGDKVKSVSLNKTSDTIQVGNTDALKATVNPSSAKNKNVTWKSSNSSVATVSASGVVTAVAEGSATITVTTEDGGYTATCTVTVTSEPVNQGRTYYLINSSNLATPCAYTWVDGGGNDGAWPGTKMTLVDSAKKLYKVELAETSKSNMIIFSNNGGSQTGNIKIPTDGKNCYDMAAGTWSTYTENIAVTSVSLNKTSATIKKGNTVALSATVNPSNATNKALAWSSSNSSVASVSTSGVVTAVSKGSAVITVKTTDGGYTATCNVTVTEPVTPVEDLVNTSFVSQHAIVGEKVVLKGSATGGYGNYKFAYYYRRNSDKTWKVAGTEWGTSQFATFKPGYADVYEICIKVQDGSGTIIKKYLSLAANKTENNLECYGSVSKTMFTFGNTITIKGSAKNNSGAVKYKYEFRKASSWTFETIKDYSSSRSVSWKAPQKGSFTIRITADDGTNKAIRTINLKVR